MAMVLSEWSEVWAIFLYNCAGADVIRLVS